MSPVETASNEQAQRERTAAGGHRDRTAAGGHRERAPAGLTQRSSLLMAPFGPSREFMSWVYQLNGRLDIDALAGAIDDVVSRHDMLRVRFESPGGREGARDGRLEQVVGRFHSGVLDIVHLDDRPKAQGLAAAVKAVETEYRDLSPWEQPWLEATLYVIAPKTNVLAVWVAEALVDGDSGTLVAAEISRAYAERAGRPVRAMPEASTASYLEWVLDHPVPDLVQERAAEHWKEMAALPIAAGSWPMAVGDRRVTRFFKVPVDEWQRMARGTPALAATPYVVVLSWLEMALARVVGAEEFAVTSAVSNRRHPMTRRMIGSFIGPVRLRAEVHAADRLEDVSPRVMAALRDAVAHSAVPVPLAEAWAQAPAPFMPPPPEVSFFMFAEREGLDLAGVRQRRFRVHMGARDVLRVNCTPDEEGGRNFFFISASAPPELLDELVVAFRSLMAAAG